MKRGDIGYRFNQNRAARARPAKTLLKFVGTSK